MQVSERGAVVVVTVVSGQCLNLWRTIEPFLANGRRAFVLDLSEVEFLNSVNVAAILTARNKVGSSEGELLLAGLSPRMLEVFHALRLERLFDLHLDLPSACALVE